MLVITHGLHYGGAQVSTIEFLRLIKNFVDVNVVVCMDADKIFVRNLLELGVPVRPVPYRLVMGYPDLAVEGISGIIKWADVVWIGDESYCVATRIKKIKDTPIVAHLHSYALICPIWSALYGLKEVCSKKCSFLRIVRCKQELNLRYAEIGIYNLLTASINAILDLVKGPTDYCIWQCILRRVLKNIENFVAVSNAMRNIYLLHMSNLTDKNLTVIYNPVTMPLRYVNFSSKVSSQDYVLYASGSQPIKGPHILLTAWKEIFEKHKDSKLYMVGCKGSWVEKKAKKLNLKGVVLLNRLPPEKLYSIMSKAKVVVMPSILPEPFGRLAAEGNVLGIPALVSNIGGLPEAIEPDITGYLTTPGNPLSLADTLDKAMSKNFSRELIQARTFERFDKEKLMKQFLNFLQDTMTCA